MNQVRKSVATGKLHFCGGSNAASCNSRGGIQMSWVSPAQIDKTPQNMFCVKCFGSLPLQHRDHLIEKGLLNKDNK